MIFRMNARTRLGPFLMLICLPVAEGAEGFWPYSSIPDQRILEQHGVHITPSWLENLQKSTLRFNFKSGGSGAFVSRDGLVLTNRHVIPKPLGRLNTPERNILNGGFCASEPAEELPMPGVSLDALQSMEEITPEVRKHIGSRIGNGKHDDAQREILARIEQRASSAEVHAEVVAFHEGAKYFLYRYRRYQDVRLVFSPESDAAPHHGGGVDQFSYPASGLDAALVRVYEQGRPARTDHYLRWSRSGPEDGMPIFVSGIPTVSSRHRTIAELEFERDTSLPLIVEAYSKLETRLSAWGSRGGKNGVTVSGDLAMARFWRRIMESRLSNLQREDFLADRRITEQHVKAELKRRSTSDSLSAYSEIETLLAEASAHYARSQLLPWGGDLPPLPWENDRPDTLLPWGGDVAGPLYSYGQILLRALDERARPDGSRARGYNEPERAQLENWLFAARTIDPGVETVRMTVYLQLLAQELGGDDPVVIAMLAGKAPAVRAAELAQNTRLADASFRKAVYESSAGQAYIDQDPMLALLHSLQPMIRRIGLEQNHYDERLLAARRRAVAGAQEILGSDMYPDATRSLRLSYGVVSGDRHHSFSIPAVTTIGTLYDWYDHQYEPTPYHLPPRWLERRSIIDQSATINFLSTADATGGNSGSPTVDAGGSLVGILFGGSSLLGIASRDIAYSDRQGERSAHVATPAILEALRTVYAAPALVQELLEGHR